MGEKGKFGDLGIPPFGYTAVLSSYSDESSGSTEFKKLLDKEDKTACSIPKPSEIKAYLDKYVIGQEEAKKAISVALINHLHKIKYNESIVDKVEQLNKNNIMLIGDSGVGKTYIIKLLADYFNLPMVIEDATKYSATGYVGAELEDMITNLYIKSGRDIKKTECGIIFIDEVDKLAQVNSNSNNNVNTTQVQYGLLKLVEGCNIRAHTHMDKHSDDVEINTDNILFIFAGSFNGLSTKLKDRVEGKGKTFGFIPNTEIHNHEISEEDLLKCGVIPELLGRIGNYVQLHTLTRQEMYDILTKTDNSTLKQFKKLFELRGLNFPLQESDFNDIIDRVVTSKLGVRSLIRELERKLSHALYI